MAGFATTNSSKKLFVSLSDREIAEKLHWSVTSFNRLEAATILQATTDRLIIAIPASRTNLPIQPTFPVTSTAQPNPHKTKLFMELTDEDLRAGLGRGIGPITDSTREVYRKKYQKMHPNRQIISWGSTQAFGQPILETLNVAPLPGHTLSLIHI